jgi:hypothetical protein
LIVFEKCENKVENFCVARQTRQDVRGAQNKSIWEIELHRISKSIAL